jgi:hypothetical protein
MYDHDPDFDPYAGLPGPDKRILHIIIGALIVIGVGCFAWAAWGHDAIPTGANPTGWTYGWDCCSATDCEQVQQSSIGETPDGYLVRRTGEVIGYADKRIKRSKDEHFHRCTPGGNVDALRSICLYVPNRGF